MAHVSSILQSHGTMDTQSKPTFVLLGHPVLFDNMLFCSFVCLTCLFAPIWLSLLVCLFACFLYLFVIPFACYWLLSLFVACTCLEQGHDFLGTSNKGNDASKKT